ncbi:zinc finger protein 468 [Homo sapiens]|uniref:Zinc finger protein 468 n=2 Tax=Homo sapiens TaxID=9606 RepID=M0R171_HUMAN|nr:zinc finger protein 468 [Homo sapiens]KAI4044519.1 zinc finger protein 468 [Homo sapiens]
MALPQVPSLVTQCHELGKRLHWAGPGKGSHPDMDGHGVRVLWCQCSWAAGIVQGPHLDALSAHCGPGLEQLPMGVTY